MVAWSACLAAASMMLALGGATAKTSPGQTSPAKPAGIAPDDGLSGGGFYIEADRLVDDDANDRVIAKGDVEARYQGRVLRAVEVDYNRRTGVITAHGKVQIINPDGTAQFADDMTLDKDMSEGFALGFSTRLADQIKIAAATAHRKGQDLTELHQVIFTPCPICAENGGKKPTWSIRAKKVIQDHKKLTIYFQNAVIQVKGITVFYLPAFWAADPTAARKSGLLLPIVTISGQRGFSWEQPYYQVISPSSDITIAPQINTKVNPFLNVDYRQRFYSGVMDIRAGYTYDQDFGSNGAKFGPATSRSYILGSGLFNLNPEWKWGFTAEQTSDSLLFEKYSIPDVYTDQGLYEADSQRLISQLYAIRQDSGSYLSVAAIEVQGLRSTDMQGTFPVVAPLIEGRWEPSDPILGGRLRIDGSAVALTPSQSIEDPALPGIESRRATFQADWQRTFIFPNGLRLDPFLNARVDLYSLANLPTSTTTSSSTPSNTTLTNAIVPQVFGTLGLNLSYPLIKRAGAVTYVLEPLAQIALSPTLHQNPRIPNEDSTDFELDDTNLFQADKSPGFDIYDGGQKLNLGGRATAFLDDGRGASILVGRSLRAEADPQIPLYSGLETALSDYVLEGEITPLQNIHMFSRWRLDTNTFAVNRLEAGADFTTSRVTAYASYLQEAQSPTGQGLSTSTTSPACVNSPTPTSALPACSVKSLDLRGEVFPIRHWGLALYGIKDFQAGPWREEDVGIVYRDDCIRVEVLYKHDETFNGTFGPSTSVVLRLTLATLGNSGYSADRPPAP